MTAGSRTRPTPNTGGRNGPRSARSRARPAATPRQLTGAVYLTLTIDDDKARAEERMNAFIAELLRPPGGGDAGAPGDLCRPGGRRRGMAVVLGARRGEPSGAAFRRRSPSATLRRSPAAREHHRVSPGTALDLTLVNPDKPRGASPHFGARPGGARRSPARLYFVRPTGCLRHALNSPSPCPSPRLRALAQTLSFRGAAAGREPGIHRHRPPE